jgi:hypothetical protein
MNSPVQFLSANGLNIGGLFNTAGAGLGIINGLQSGSPLGTAGALTQATSLYGKLAGNATASQFGGIGGSALGLINGIQQGGVAGYSTAGIDAAKLGIQTGLIQNSPALQGALGIAGAGLSTYNFIKNYQSGATGADALNGAQAGASIGSMIVPGIGTVVGGLIGGAAGALSSAFGPGKKDPETYSWDGYLNAVSSNPQAAGQVSNPYLFLAGLFDEKGKSTVPMVAQYGRMGEQKFTNDFMTQIQTAIRNGTVSAKSDPAFVYNKVVAPWVNSMNGGQGWGKVGKEYTAAAQGLLKQMTTQFMNGSYSYNWKAVGGDTPFAPVQQAEGYGRTLTRASKPSPHP